MRAWHFLCEGHKLRDGRTAPADGEWLRFKGEPILCEQGLHASVDAFDALQNAPGPILCMVDCAGQIVRGDDKLVCTERRIVARMDATDLMRHFARMQALSVVHLWDAPDVVLDYMMTGDESIRTAAWDAARAAARDAAWDAARAAARTAAWAAARAAARDAAWDAARAAARDAAWDAARDAAWDAARDAAWDDARRDFNALVAECFEGCK